MRVSSTAAPACRLGEGCRLEVKGRTLAALLTSSIVFSIIIFAMSSCRCFSSSYLVSVPSPEASGSGGGAKGLLPPAGLVANAREIREVARAAARARGLNALLNIGPIDVLSVCSDAVSRAWLVAVTRPVGVPLHASCNSTGSCRMCTMCMHMYMCMCITFD